MNVVGNIFHGYTKIVFFAGIGVGVLATCTIVYVKNSIKKVFKK